MKITNIILISSLIAVFLGCTHHEKHAISPEAKQEMEYEAKILNAKKRITVTQDMLKKYQIELDALLTEAIQYQKESKKYNSAITKASKVILKIEYCKEELPKAEKQLSTLLKEKPNYQHITPIQASE